MLTVLLAEFNLCSIKHVLTVWPPNSTLACLVTKQCFMMFGRLGLPFTLIHHENVAFRKHYLKRWNLKTPALLCSVDENHLKRNFSKKKSDAISRHDNLKLVINSSQTH